MTRAAIYRRVSGRKQEDNHSLPEQLDKCEQRCREKGYDIVADLFEVYTGAELEERPQISKLLDMTHNREIDVIVATTLDRLSRDMNHQGVILYACEKNNVAIELTEEVFDDTAAGRFMRMASGFFAEMEREKTRERTRRGTVHRVKQGLMLPGSNPLYGYRYADDEKSRYIIDPVTAPIVQRIWHDAASGKRFRKVAKELTDDGVLTPKDYLRLQRGEVPLGREWVQSTIQGILDNPAYYGQHSAYRWIDEKVEVKDRMSNKPVTRRSHKEREVGDKRVIIGGAAPALVSLEVARAAQDRRKENRASALRNNQYPERGLLRSGYARCGLCHGIMTITKQHRLSREGTVAYIYRCINSKLHRIGHEKHCTGVTVHINWLDEMVWNDVLAILSQPHIFTVEAQKRFKEHEHQDTLEGLRHQVDKLDHSVANIRKAIQLVDGVAVELLADDLKKIQQEKHKALEDIARLEKNQADWESHYNRLKSLAAGLESFLRAGGQLTYQQKRDILYFLTVRIIVYPHGSKDRYSGVVGINGEIVIAGRNNCEHTR